MPFRPDIEGLRGVAVLCVLFFHFATPGFAKGFIGLDIFFVLSGFLITQVILKEIAQDRFSLVRFWSRRVKRLFPALLFTVVVSSLCAWALLDAENMQTLQKSVLASIFSYANVFFHLNVDFGSSPPIMHPLLNVWSLSVEEQFYLIWPIILATAITRFSAKTCLTLALALLALSLALSEIGVRSGGTAAFYLLHGRAFELLIGACLALSNARLNSPHMANGAGLLGLALLAASLAGVDAGAPYPGLPALIPCLGAALIILSGTGGGGIAAKHLSVAPLRWAGRISYSLYLIHWPIISFGMFYAQKPATPLVNLALCAASVGVAAFMWRYVETPFRENSFEPRTVFAAALTAAVPIAVAIAFFAYLPAIPS